jgi:tetratricopeptide (TPR) repeat protein
MASIKHETAGRRASLWSRWAGIFVLLGLTCSSLHAVQAQARSEGASKGPQTTLIQNLPLDSANRAALSDAVKGHNYVEAERILIDAIHRDPKSPQLLTFLGGIYFLNGDYLECAVAMKKAEEFAPLNNPDRFTLAMAYIVLNHSDWAQPEVERLTHSDPHNALYFYWLSRINYNQDDYDWGVAAAQKAIGLDPRFARAYDNLGLCYEALGKYSLAIHSYQQSVSLNRDAKPPSPWPPLDLGALFVKLRKPQEARAYIMEALRYDPRFPEAHFRLGLLLQQEGRQQDAIEQLKQAATLNPAYAEPHYALGRSYERIGNLKKARAEFALFEKLKHASQKNKPH